ncbi:hypothetical protein HOC80_04310 [archaeon]|jgi:hypothetical protein|nr:hypothetical protein [archaeon]
MFCKWIKKRMKLLEWYDISLIKLTTFAFALMIAKLWVGILYLDWYWYLVIAIVAAIVPGYKFYFK